MEPERHSFYRSYSKEEDFDGVYKTTIWQCDEDNPPTRMNENVKELCSISSDLNIPYELLEDHPGANGNMIKKLFVDIEMVPSGASNVFSIIYEGIKLASQDARIDFQ